MKAQGLTLPESWPCCCQQSLVCPFPPAPAPAPKLRLMVMMTMTQPALGPLESSTCCPESAQQTQNLVPQCLGCSARVHNVLKTTFPEIHLVAKANLGQQEALSIHSVWGPACLAVETLMHFTVVTPQTLMRVLHHTQCRD